MNTIKDIKNVKLMEPILLVEDEADHARLVKKSLTEHGRLLNEIYWVKNGIEAMEYITHTGPYNEKNAPRPGLILLDLKMPLKDGFQVLAELKSDTRYKAIPVVVLTTSINSDDAKKALDLGANDFIVKPVRFPDFVQKVGHLGNYWGFISDSYIGNAAG
jgi:two-component system response regulator